jgi:hypothetical protein
MRVFHNLGDEQKVEIAHAFRVVEEPALDPAYVEMVLEDFVLDVMWREGRGEKLSQTERDVLERCTYKE